MPPGLTSRPTLTHTYHGGRFGEVTLPIWYVTTEAQLAEVVDAVLYCDELGLDLETGGLNPRKQRLATMQIGYPLGDDPWAVVIDVRCFTRRQLQPLLERLTDGRLLVGHNMKFEAKWMRHNYGVALDHLYCSQLTEQVVRAGLLTHPAALTAGADVQGLDTGQTQMVLNAKRKRVTKSSKTIDGESRAALVPVSLGRMMARYGGVDVDKDHDLRLSFDRTPEGQHSDRQIRYAASDVVYPFWLRGVQQPLVEERGLRQILRVEFALVQVLADMELAGMNFDQAKWLQLAAEAEAEVERQQAVLDALVAPFSIQQDLFGGIVSGRPTNPFTGKPWNWGSSDQVRDAIVMYCEQRKLQTELVVTEARAKELRVRYGAEWAEKVNRWERQRAAQEERKPNLVRPDQAPMWLIPEHEHFMLLSADWKQLTIGEVRGILPPELVRPIIAYSKASMKASTYGRSYLRHVDDSTGRIHFELTQNMAATGRLSVSPNCYDSETEILTTRGWVRFPELQAEDQVAQVDPYQNMRITFTRPTAIVNQPYEGPMIHLDSSHIELLVTPNHRMLLQTRRSGLVTVTEAKDFPEDHRHYHAGFVRRSQSVLTEIEARYAVLLALRGRLTRCGYGVEIHVPKAEQILRVRMVLTQLGYGFTEHPDSNGYVTFQLLPPAVPPVTKLLTRELKLGAWLLQCSGPVLDAFLDEFFLWEGEPAVGDRDTLQWVQTVCALRGIRAKLTSRTKMRRERGKWYLRVRRKNYSFTDHVRTTEVPYQGTIHCVSVPTGFVVVRRWSTRHDAYKVSLSGNTMAIPRDGEYRSAFIPRPGYKFCIADLSQIEPRLLAQVSKDSVYLDTFQRGGDIYISVGERAYEQAIDKHTSEGKLLRQSAKVQVLSLAYNMQAAKYRMQYTLAMADLIRMGVVQDLELDGAKDAFNKFFEVCPGVKEYQKDCMERTDFTHERAQSLYDDLVQQEVVYIKAPCGRIRLWTRDQNRFTEPTNFPIQGAGATGTKIALILMAREIRDRGWDARLLNVIHDEIIVEAYESIAEEVAQVLKVCMVRAFDRICPDVPVVAEFPESCSTGVANYWVK